MLNMPEGYRDGQTSHLILVDIRGDTFSKKDTSRVTGLMGCREKGESLKSTENCNLPKSFQTSITTFPCPLSAITLFPIHYVYPALSNICLDFFEFNLFIEVGYCTWQFGQLCI